MNITLDDCIGLCGLEEEEVAAIAEHEHAPEIVAAALAQCLMQDPDGPGRIRDMIVEDIHAALKRHDKAHAGELLAALHRFVAAHRDELAMQPAGKGAR